MGLLSWAKRPVKPLFRNIVLTILVLEIAPVVLGLAGDAWGSTYGRIRSHFRYKSYLRYHPPDSPLEKARKDEARRVRDYVSKEARHVMAGDLTFSGKSENTDVLVVIMKDPTWPALIPTNDVVCSLLSPPANLKQELFREVRIMTGAAREDIQTNPAVIAFDKEGCADDQGNPDRCAQLSRSMSKVFFIDRFHAELPFQPGCKNNTVTAKAAVP